MPFLLMFCKPIAGVLLLAALVAAFVLLKHGYDNEKREEGAAPVRAEFAAYRAKEAAIVAGLATQWDAKRQEAETNANAAEVERTKSFSLLQERARVLATGGGDAGGHLRLYDDARAAAETAGTPAKSPEAAPAPSSSTEEYIVSLYEWASVCKARVDEWASFYQSLRSSNGNL